MSVRYSISGDGRAKCEMEVLWKASLWMDFNSDWGSNETSVRDLQSAKQVRPMEMIEKGMDIF